MNAGLILLFMMAAFLGVVAAVIVHGRRRPGPLSRLRRLALGAGGLLVLFFASTLTFHMCGAGLATRQFWLAWLLWLTAAASRARPRPLALAFGLCSSFVGASSRVAEDG